MIPNEVRQLKQWTFSYNLKELKRPMHTNYNHNGSLSYLMAKRKAGKDKYMGFYVTSDDPYLLLDIDHIENPNDPSGELPLPIAILLQRVKTYSEISPSGKGIRVILKLPDKEDKAKIKGQIFYLIDSGENKRNVQINFGKPWMTITSNPTTFAEEKVGEVTLDTLNEIFLLKYVDEVGKRLPPPKSEKPAKLPSFSDIWVALNDLPLDSNPRICRAYSKVFGTIYDHYDYWIKVLMAFHDYGRQSGKSVQCLEAAIDWSAKDTLAFKSEEDVTNHWQSFSDGEVSYKTIFGLYYATLLRWPVPRKQSKEQSERGASLLPTNSEYSNFKALMIFYDIRLYRDQTDHNIIYLSADSDIVKKFFMLYQVKQHFGKFYGPFTTDTFTPAFHMMCQQLGFIGIGHGVITNFLSNFLAETREEINFVRLYFDTPFRDLPPDYQENANGKDTIDDLFKCISINTADLKELELYKRYYKCWWMGMVRNIYFQDDANTNNCVLLLTGREQIRKTSHYKYLLPTFMREQVAFTTHGFSDEGSVRDVCKLSASNLMIVWDELEQYLNAKTESNFKKIIDNNDQKFIDKYQVVPKTIRPIAIYGATSNQSQFKLGDEGSRRLFHIPVTWVDTDAIAKINWHGLINNIRREIAHELGQGNIPWLLDEKELEYQLTLHTEIRLSSNLDIALEEIFNTKAVLTQAATSIPKVSSLQKKNSMRAMTTKEVIEMLIRYGVSHNDLGRAAVVHALERMCGNYTRTRRKSKQFKAPACIVHKGLATQQHYKKWLIPPVNEYAYSAMYGMFEEDD